jgi:tetratricopeptide (TPR) repeat protein
MKATFHLRRPKALVTACGVLLVGALAFSDESKQQIANSIRSRRLVATGLACERRYEQAEAKLRQLISESGLQLGPAHEETLECRQALGMTLLGAEKFEKAEAELREVLKTQSKTLPENDPGLLQSHYYLALTLKRENKLREAREHSKRAFEGAREKFGEQHPKTRLFESLWKELKPAKE